MRETPASDALPAGAPTPTDETANRIADLQARIADLTAPADKMVRLSEKGHAALKRLAANSGRTHADLLGEALRLLDAQTPSTSESHNGK